jgi:hypothetical protein
MGKKFSRINQKVYRMKGCSKKTRKCYLGGGDTGSALAYTGQSIPSRNNPFLAYTGKGGSCNTLPPTLVLPLNTNATDKSLPNTGPPIGMPTAMTNEAGPQQGGNCGCSGIPVISGGKSRKRRGGRGCGALCGLAYTAAGGASHRIGCKCSTCKIKQNGGNPGLPYPAGLAGLQWTAEIKGWPGVDGIQGDRNYNVLNTYPTDVQTAMVSPGPNPPFLVGGKKKRFSRKQRGGTFSNFLSQDLINLGRQFQFGLGSAYNGLAGYSSPVNPLPWKGQLSNTPSLSSIKLSSV